MLVTPAGRAAPIDPAVSSGAPLLARVFGEHAYPTAARVGTAASAAHDSADHAYEFGLQRVLDGLAVLIGNRH